MSSRTWVGESASLSETPLSRRDHSNHERNLEARSQPRTWADVAAERPGQTTRDQWIHEGLNGELFDEFKEDLEESDDDDEYECPVRYHRQQLARSSETQASAQRLHPSATDFPALGGSPWVTDRVPEVVSYQERRVSFYERLFRMYRRAGLTAGDAHREMILHCHFTTLAIDYGPVVVEYAAQYFEYLAAEQEEIHLHILLHEVAEQDNGAVGIESPYHMRRPVWDHEREENEVGDEPIRSEPSAQITFCFSDPWQGDFWFDADARTIGRHRRVIFRAIVI
jgi:hypothetical protein